MRKLLVALFLLLAAPSSFAGKLPLLGVGGGASGATACTEGNTFIARTSGLDATHITAYGNLICGLVTDGVWSKLDVLYIFATQDSTTALLNLVSTSYSAVLNGSPAFTADLGFTGIAASTTVYIDTQFNPNTASSPNFVQNSAHLSSWQTNNVQSVCSIGSADTTQNYIIPRLSDNNFYTRINNFTGVNETAANTDSNGHYIGDRNAGNSSHGWRNGSIVSTNSNTATTIVNRNIYVLGYNNAGVASGSSYRVGQASIGSTMNGGSDGANLYARLRTYMTAVGVP